MNLDLLFNFNSVEQSTLSSEVFSPDPVYSRNDFYSNLTYLLIYTFLWNFLIEISLMIIFHFKQSKSYISNHSFINLCIIITQLINNIFLFKNHVLDLNNEYLVYAICLLLLELGQIFLGQNFNNNLLQTQLKKRIFVLGFFHRNFGKLLYILRKLQLAYYAYYYLEYNTSVSPYLIIIIVFSLTFIFHMMTYIIFKTGEFSDRKHKWVYLKTNSAQKHAFDQLLMNIKTGAFDCSIRSSISMVSGNTGLEEGLMEKEIKWVVIENRVYDITDLRHPYGNFILRHINGKDITREINGLKSFRFSDPENNYRKNKKHKHVPTTFKSLSESCIGDVDPTGLITDSGTGNSKGVEDSEMTIQLSYLAKQFRFANLGFITKQYYWKIDNAFEFDQRFRIAFCFKYEKDYVVNLSSYWLHNFGKYFLVKRDDDKKDFMYPILSLSPYYLQIKTEWYGAFPLELQKELINFTCGDLQELSSLYDVLYNITDNKQRRLTGLGEDTKTAYLPLFYDKKVNQNAKPVFQGTKFGLSGPLGLGLGFNPDSTSKIIFILKDTGIVPILDFLEFLSQRALIEYTNNEIENKIFKSEYLYSYANDIEFYLYWEISDDFYTMAETLGLNSIFTIDKVYSLSEEKNKNINQLLKKVILVSSRCSYKGQKVEVRRNNITNIDDIMILMDTRNVNQIKRFVIKGEDSFVDKILKTKNLNMEKVLVL